MPAAGLPVDPPYVSVKSVMGCLHAVAVLSSNSLLYFLLSFFPVHTTSMKNYNHMLSTDNKGYAALKFEELKNPGTFPGQVSIQP